MSNFLSSSQSTRNSGVEQRCGRLDNMTEIGSFVLAR